MLGRVFCLAVLLAASLSVRTEARGSALLFDRANFLGEKFLIHFQPNGTSTSRKCVALGKFDNRASSIKITWVDSVKSLTLFQEAGCSGRARTLTAADGPAFDLSRTFNNLASSYLVSYANEVITALEPGSGNFVLIPGDTLMSPNGNHTLVLGENGTLVLSVFGNPVWSSGDRRGTALVYQFATDGNLVLSNVSGIAWAAGVERTGAYVNGSKIVISDGDGALLVDNGNSTHWVIDDAHVNCASTYRTGLATDNILCGVPKPGPGPITVEFQLNAFGGSVQYGTPVPPRRGVATLETLFLASEQIPKSLSPLNNDPKFTATFTATVRAAEAGSYHFHLATDHSADLWVNSGDKTPLISIQIWGVGGVPIGGVERAIRSPINLSADSLHQVQVVLTTAGGPWRISLWWSKPADNGMFYPFNGKVTSTVFPQPPPVPRATLGIPAPTVFPPPPPVPRATLGTPTPAGPNIRVGPNHKGSNVPVIAILSALGLPFVVLVLCALSNVASWRHGKGRWPFTRKTPPPVTGPGTARSYTYEELRLATDNFSDQSVLGRGGFGVVHKGVLGDGRKVAVKKLEKNPTSEFEAEVKAVSEIRHRNLVRLLGSCTEGENHMLVYELVENGSLSSWLFDTSPSRLLTWEQRERIARGAARALKYLHHDITPLIIHRDIKPENILLDRDFRTKLADFGLARILEGDKVTTTPEGKSLDTTGAGTWGYIAPEVHRQIIASQGDVYSFGVVLLALLTGRKPLREVAPRDVRVLINDAWDAYSANTWPVLVDPRLGGSFPKDRAQLILNVALCCVNEKHTARPNMIAVEHMLEGLLPAKPAPIYSSIQGPLNLSRSTGSFQAFTESTSRSSSTRRSTSPGVGPIRVPGGGSPQKQSQSASLEAGPRSFADWGNPRTRVHMSDRRSHQTQRSVSGPIRLPGGRSPQRQSQSATLGAGPRRFADWGSLQTQMHMLDRRRSHQTESQGAGPRRFADWGSLQTQMHMLDRSSNDPQRMYTS